MAGFEADALSDIERKNESISSMELIYLTTLPKTWPWAKFTQYRSAARSVALGSSSGLEKFSILSRAARAALRALFEVGNERLQKKLGIQGNPLEIALEAEDYFDPRDLISSAPFLQFQQNVLEIVQSQRAQNHLP